ncbi:MAG: sugar phosphate isomerase/epimerase family protein [Chthonomonadales bacterium]
MHLALLAIVMGGVLPVPSGTEALRRNLFFAMDTCLKPRYPASDLPTDAQLDLVHDTGYGGISWTLGDPTELRPMLAAARKRKLKLVALYAGATLEPAGLEPDARLEQAMKELEGSDTIVWLHIGSRAYSPSSPDGDAAALAGLRALADAAARYRLRIALYPHVGDWLERIQDAVRLVQKVQRKNVGVTFNLCHCLFVGDEARIPQLLADARPHLFVVTLNGADAEAAGSGWNRLIRPLDEGTYDLRPVLRTLAALKYRGPIGLQGFGVAGDARRNLERSMAAWKRLLEE